METYNWYQNLIKPSFAPPAYLFGIVWSVLYPIIFISFGYTVYVVYKRGLNRNILKPIIVNLISNFLFSPIQFVLQNNFLAVIDTLIVLVSIIWFMKITYKGLKTISFVQIPYLLWVSFATILQISITWLNR